MDTTEQFDSLSIEQQFTLLLANMTTLKQHSESTYRMKGMIQSYNMFDSSMYKDHKMMISIINRRKSVGSIELTSYVE